MRHGAQHTSPKHLRRLWMAVPVSGACPATHGAGIWGIRAKGHIHTGAGERNGCLVLGAKRTDRRDPARGEVQPDLGRSPWICDYYQGPSLNIGPTGVAWPRKPESKWSKVRNTAGGRKHLLKGKTYLVEKGFTSKQRENMALSAS